VSFVRQQSLALADRLLSERNASDAVRLREAYRLTVGRLPNPHEVARAQSFLAQYSASYHAASPASAPVTVVAKPVPAVEGDDMDRTEYMPSETIVQPGSPQAAAWMSFVQALYASAEFRFVR